LILKNSKDLVVSSQAVKNDFINFYNVPNSIKIHIYHFVSIIDSLPSLTSSEIKSKYGLPESYYIVSNQFQKHKNHLVVFKAVDQLQKKGIPVHVVLTGRFSSDSNSPYMQELHRLVAENNLKNSISFLGLIPRSDQLLLMKYAKAIIQPSLFEGWSTVIEDAKSLQVPVIASNLDVNIEQLEEKGTYFEPHDERALATILEEYPERNYDKELYEPYESRIKKAAYELLSVFK
jgi:glycosyltransferase involved in cell wall biosynthesis